MSLKIRKLYYINNFILLLTEAKELRSQLRQTTAPFIYNCISKLVNQTTADYWLLLRSPVISWSLLRSSVISRSLLRLPVIFWLFLRPLVTFRSFLKPFMYPYQSGWLFFIMWLTTLLTDRYTMSDHLRIDSAIILIMS